VKGIIVSRIIFVRIKNFITYRISATLQLLIFFFISVFLFDPNKYAHDDDSTCPTYFHLPVIMLMIIRLLNDGTLISIAYDSVTPSAFSERWDLPVLFFIGEGLSA
jgi:H+-transporting ATPase